MTEYIGAHAMLHHIDGKCTQAFCVAAGHEPGQDMAAGHSQTADKVSEQNLGQDTPAGHSQVDFAAPGALK